jgi:hypothetical protein
MATDARFALWSRSGFTAGLKRLAKEKGVLLFDLKDVAAGPSSR